MSAPRTLELLLFAGLRARAGRDRLHVEVPASTRAGELLALVERAHPALGSLRHVRLAVDQEFVEAETLIPEGAELALIPPVSGGSDEQLGRRSLLSPHPLDIEWALARVRHEDSGGLTTFTGQVRRSSRGKSVEYLDYEAYAPMALKAMDEIAEAIESRIEGARVAIAHRIGRLVVGEVAVIIAASAPHRAEAFEACRDAIEALKQDVPIWKREVDADGGEWIGQGP